MAVIDEGELPSVNSLDVVVERLLACAKSLDEHTLQDREAHAAFRSAQEDFRFRLQAIEMRHATDDERRERDRGDIARLKLTVYGVDGEAGMRAQVAAMSFKMTLATWFLGICASAWTAHVLNLIFHWVDKL